MPPKIIPPNRPLPIGRASVHCTAGRRYQSDSGSSGGGASPWSRPSKTVAKPRPAFCSASVPATGASLRPGFSASNHSPNTPSSGAGVSVAARLAISSAESAAADGCPQNSAVEAITALRVGAKAERLGRRAQGRVFPTAAGTGHFAAVKIELLDLLRRTVDRRHVVPLVGFQLRSRTADAH